MVQEAVDIQTLREIIENQQLVISGQADLIASLQGGIFGAPVITATSLGGSGAFYYSIYIQMTNMTGLPIETDGTIEFWLSDSEFGALTSYAPTGLNVVTGKVIEQTASYVKAITSGGLLEINIQQTDPGTPTTYYTVASVAGHTTIGPQAQ